jgi:hypothetical protein
MKFRPRFTVRTLAIFVTLVCAYFAAWDATKRYGIQDYSQVDRFDPLIYDESPMPFVISQYERSGPKSWEEWRSGIRSSTKRRYYLWVFGLRFKLPFETDAE